MISVRRVELPLEGLETLVHEARAEGFKFLDRLVEDWRNGSVTFLGRGEALLGVFSGAAPNEELVAVGGLTIDPYVGREDIGRLRRIYVRRMWRRQGLGKSLVEALIQRAENYFLQVRLRTENDEAVRLYERLGFAPISDEHATHVLLLRPEES